MTLNRVRSALTRAVPIVALVTGLSACYDDPFSPYWDRGTYYLSYANNRPVPTIVSGGSAPGSARIEVTRGSLTLRRDYSYKLLVDVREWTGTGQFYEYTKVFAGTYENDDRAIWLTYYEPGDYYSSSMVANWRNGRIEVAVPGVDGGYPVLCVFD
ncbi:MAG: hypothetical protein HYV19_10200 [Gemmatimonadetes bacterium]|nr:hypothetical protein [Gemmatimonadota bacterium]